MKKTPIALDGASVLKSALCNRKFAIAVGNFKSARY